MEKKIKVKNRSDYVVTYTIPELGERTNVRRVYSPQEVKTVSFEELETLSFSRGGKSILTHYLQVSDEETLEKLGIVPEFEYFMSEEDVKNLVKSGSYDSFLDALDFAPAGVIDLIKKYAVELPCNDNAKREAMRKILKFDVDSALRINREASEVDGTESATPATRQRRVQVETQTETTEVTPPAAPKYKIIG